MENANVDEENGNLMNNEKISDEEDESLEDSLACSLGNLTVDLQNANAQGNNVHLFFSDIYTFYHTKM